MDFELRLWGLNNFTLCKTSNARVRLIMEFSTRVSYGNLKITVDNVLLMALILMDGGSLATRCSNVGMEVRKYLFVAIALLRGQLTPKLTKYCCQVVCWRANRTRLEHFAYSTIIYTWLALNQKDFGMGRTSVLGCRVI